jgi:hypothetical protein
MTTNASIGRQNRTEQIDNENERGTISAATPVNRHQMTADPQSQPISESDRLEMATDEAIAACGGNPRDAVRALIVANEFLEVEVCELMQAVSHAYARKKFKPRAG